MSPAPQNLLKMQPSEHQRNTNVWVQGSESRSRLGSVPKAEEKLGTKF